MQHLSVDSIRDACDLDWRPGMELPPCAIVHCKTEFAADCLAAMGLGDGRYVLVTHRSDLPFTDALAAAIPPNVCRVFARNRMTTDPRVEALPIGLAEHDLPHGNWGAVLDALREPRGNELLYAGFALNTNRTRRAAVEAVRGLATVEVYDDYRVQPRTHAEYLRRLRRHRFILSPPGNGIDCHRCWEALYLQATPVCLRSPATEPLAELFPMLLVADWREVTRERLEAWRRPELDASPLFTDWWRNRWDEVLEA